MESKDLREEESGRGRREGWEKEKGKEGERSP